MLELYKYIFMFTTLSFLPGYQRRGDNSYIDFYWCQMVYQGTTLNKYPRQPTMNCFCVLHALHGGDLCRWQLVEYCCAMTAKAAGHLGNMSHRPLCYFPNNFHASLLIELVLGKQIVPVKWLSRTSPPPPEHPSAWMPPPTKRLPPSGLKFELVLCS